MAEKEKVTGINNWPEDDRPREKLLKKGARALSSSELLAILLRTGTNGSSAIDIARKIMNKFGSFRNMARRPTRAIGRSSRGLGTRRSPIYRRRLR